MTLRRQTEVIKVKNLNATGLVDRLFEFDIDASEAGRGCLEIVINDGSIKCIVNSLGKRRYHASFCPRQAIPYVIEMKFNGNAVPESPFTIDIRERTFTLSGPGLQRIPVNKSTSFTVCNVGNTADNTCVVSAAIKSPSGSQLENTILKKDDGIYVVEYNPVDVGTYSIEVSCDGHIISDSPYSSNAYNINAVVVSTVSNYLAGEMAEFEIDTSEAGDGELGVMILSEEGEDNCIIPHTKTLLQKGLYLVAFTAFSSEPTYAVISFDREELPHSPFILGSPSPAPHDLLYQAISAESRVDSPPRTQQPHSDNSSTCRSIPESQFPGSNLETRRRQDQLGRREHSTRLPTLSPDYPTTPGLSIDGHSWSTGSELTEPLEIGGTSDEMNEDLGQRHSVITDVVMAGFKALLACVNESEHDVCIVRQGLVDELLELYKDPNVANETLNVIFEGEPGVDCKGLTRDLFTNFWREVSKDLFRGEDCLVPDLPLHRIRKESWKFECLGRILSHTVALTGTIPPMLAISTLIKLTSDSEVDDDCLLKDFLLFVTTREKTLLTKAMSNPSSLTEAEYDRLRNFYTAHGFHKIPKGSEIKEQLLAIAYQDLVKKPGSLISKMRKGIPESHRAAFWHRLSAEDITHILQAQRPTPEKVAHGIVTPKEDMTDDEDRTIYFLKEFVASLDFDTLTDFLIFVTGSVHQPDKISVTFTTLTGLDRRPISHTCFNHLEVPTSYSCMKEFKREFLSVLASPEAFQYSEL